MHLPTAFTIILLGPLSVFCLPSLSNLVRDSAPIQEWENPDGGNTKVDVNHTMINWGSAPPWHVLDKISENCLSSGCTGKSIIMDTKLVDENENLKEATISLTPTGSFGDSDYISRDQLIELIKAVSAQGYRIETVEYIEEAAHPGVCPHLLCAPIPDKKAKIDQYHQSADFYIRNEEPSEALQAWLSAYIVVNEQNDGSGNLCEDITTLGGAIAGAFSGIAGGAFALASLACT